MSETKHTPGPWTASAMFEGVKPCGHRVIANGYQLAHCNTYGETATLKETEANANLIAAGPALEAEATNILRLFDRDNIPVNQEVRLSGSGIRVFVTYRHADRLRAAIAKAKGE